MAGLVDYGASSDEETTEAPAAPAVPQPPVSRTPIGDSGRGVVKLPAPKKAVDLDFLDGPAGDDDDPLMAQPKSSLSLLLGSLPAPKSIGGAKGQLNKKQADLLERRRKLFSLPTLDDVRLFCVCLLELHAAHYYAGATIG
jgi:hypothetical protein